MCIKPQRGKCQPPDGTILVLTKTKPCDQPFMQFSLSADGTLKHHCSGKMVCPRKPAQGKRCELMISSKCQPQDGKFERTAGMISKLAFSFLRLKLVLRNSWILPFIMHPRGSIGCPPVPSNTHDSRLVLKPPLKSNPPFQILQNTTLPVVSWPSKFSLSLCLIVQLRLVLQQFCYLCWSNAISCADVSIVRTGPS